MLELAQPTDVLSKNWQSELSSLAERALFVYTSCASSIAPEGTLMVEESPPPSRAAEESTEGKEGHAIEPDSELDGCATETKGDVAFLCECGESNGVRRSCCKGEPFYKEHEGKRYCVLHYPGKEKTAAFEKALQRKLVANDFNFYGVWFPDKVDFSYFRFGANANFGFATFSSDVVFNFATFGAEAGFGFATFSTGASFYSAVFSATTNFGSAKFSADANFYYAKFAANAHFSNVEFSANANFNGAKFNAPVSFSRANFSENANFSSATFNASASFAFSVFNKEGYFVSATFSDSLSFSGSASERTLKDGTHIKDRGLARDPSLDFQHIRIERPERIAFHTLNLRPHWFVNCDSGKFVFTDVGWEWDRINIKEEIAALETNKVSSPSRLLAITCRQLAENAETNNRYEEASNFRYWAMDLARRTKWNRWKFWKTDWLHMLYWAVSGYGERILRALGVLAAVWLVFALLYTRVGFMPLPPKPSNDGESSMMAAIMSMRDGTGQPLEFSRAFTYSLGVMSLQKPEPKPLTGTAQTLVLLETILGPLQAALLALAIRRKFMR